MLGILRFMNIRVFLTNALRKRFTVLSICGALLFEYVSCGRFVRDRPRSYGGVSANFIRHSTVNYCTLLARRRGGRGGGAGKGRRRDRRRNVRPNVPFYFRDPPSTPPPLPATSSRYPRERFTIETLRVSPGTVRIIVYVRLHVCARRS